MKQYPSISGMPEINGHCYIFEKLDGSNIRSGWNRKRGFYKFGTRRRLLDPKELILGEAIELFLEKYANDLDSLFRKKKLLDVVCFSEFFGPNSFAGYHVEEKHDIVLFDMSPRNMSMLPPKDFVEWTKGIDACKPIYVGPYDSNIANEVKRGEFPGQSFEGVIVKSKTNKKNKLPTMFKIKSDAWKERLKEKCAGDMSLFNKLL